MKAAPIHLYYMRIETTILRHLVYNENYAKKVLPFIQEEYFEDVAEKALFIKIKDFTLKYNASPTKEALAIDIEKITNEALYKETVAILDQLKKPEKTSDEWLIENTEKFCQDRSIHNAIMESIGIIQGNSQKTKEALPEILKDALSVSFDPNVGHDYFEDHEERYDFYHRVEEKIPFDLELLNKATRGGLPKKTLNVILAGVHVGKTLAMCHMAASHLQAGKNVLYISLEMSEEKIAERIDANLLNVMLDELETLPKDIYEKKIERVRRKTLGKLIVKEFPTASAHVGHFRHLINELALKKDFIPDVIYVDYLNIACSSRIKAGANINSYTYVKHIAEELRGLAIEKKVPIVTATQVTRTGFQSSDIEMTDTSESFALPAIADFMIALSSNDQLKALNQYLVKQLKNRYRDLNLMPKFIIGVDRARMKLYDVEQSAQDIHTEVPVMDNTTIGEKLKEENMRNKFAGLKV